MENGPEQCANELITSYWTAGYENRWIDEDALSGGFLKLYWERWD